MARSSHGPERSAVCGALLVGSVLLYADRASAEFPRVAVGFSDAGRRSSYIIHNFGHIVRGELEPVRTLMPLQAKPGDRPRLERIRGMGLSGGGHAGRPGFGFEIPLISRLKEANAVGARIPHRNGPIPLDREGPAARIPSVHDIVHDHSPVQIFRNQMAREEQVSASPAFWVEQRPGGVEVLVLPRQMLGGQYKQDRRDRELEKAKECAGHSPTAELNSQQEWALGNFHGWRSLFPPGIPDPVLKQLIVSVAENGRPEHTDYGNYSHKAMVELTYPTGKKACFPVVAVVDDRRIIGAFPHVDLHEVFSMNPLADSVSAAEQLAYLETTPRDGVSLGKFSIRPPSLRREMKVRMRADLLRQLDELIPQVRNTERGFSTAGLDPLTRQMVRTLKRYDPGLSLTDKRGLLFEGFFMGAKDRKKKTTQRRMFERLGPVRLSIALGEQLSLDAAYGRVASAWAVPQ